MKKVHIVNSDWHYDSMWSSFGWDIVPLEANPDVIQFTGGSDVSPHLYGEKNVRSYCDASRDIYEQKIFNQFVRKVFFVGICRGGQFLNVMNGGRMWQHVDGHAIGRLHSVTDLRTGKSFMCTSTHHQMMRPSETAMLIAKGYNEHENEISQSYTDEFGTERASLITSPQDVEVLWYPNTQSLCFQPHPEWDDKGDTREYYKLLIARYYGEI